MYFSIEIVTFFLLIGFSSRFFFLNSHFYDSFLSDFLFLDVSLFTKTQIRYERNKNILFKVSFIFNILLWKIQKNMCQKWLCQCDVTVKWDFHFRFHGPKEIRKSNRVTMFCAKEGLGKTMWRDFFFTFDMKRCAERMSVGRCKVVLFADLSIIPLGWI